MWYALHFENDELQIKMSNHFNTLSMEDITSKKLIVNLLIFSTLILLVSTSISKNAQMESSTYEIHLMIHV